MSYYATHSISVECENEEMAQDVADYFERKYDLDENRTCIDGNVVSTKCYSDIDEEEWGELTALFPGSILTDEYYGEDREIGVIYAKNGKFYSAPAEIVFPPIEMRLLEPINEEKTIDGRRKK